MPLRLVDVLVPVDRREEADAILEERSPLDAWVEPVDEERIRVRILAPAEATEGILDDFEDRLGTSEGFRTILMAVEATIPRPSAEVEDEEEPAEPGLEEAEEDEEDEEENEPLRVSREELYANLSEAADWTSVKALMVVLSTVVAAIGMLDDNVAVVVGAMVIAPLLGPIVALGLATTLADRDLAVRSTITSFAGAALALALSCGLGLVVAVNPEGSEIALRTSVDLSDLALAIAAGSAGTLAFTSGFSAAVVGVMVAVALLPPLVACGLLLGSAHWHAAFGAGLLTVANVIGVNLAGVTTFLLQGLGPRNWWEESRARKASRIAIAVWLLLLGGLVLAILFAPR